MSNAWFFEKFELIADLPDAVSRMRELVLELAMTGRLVAQEPLDEPAEELILKIEANRERLKSTGEWKGGNLPAFEPTERIGIPTNWKLMRLGEMANYATGSKVESAVIPEDAWLLDLEDIEPRTSRILTRKRYVENPSASTKTYFQAGDVLYGKLRPYLNKVIVADTSGFCTTEIVAIRTYSLIDAEFLRLALRRPAFVAYATEKSYGMNLPRLSTEDARLAPIPLPPLSEQRRIVAKVEELMGICDRLELEQRERESSQRVLVRSSLQRFSEEASVENLGYLFHRSYTVSPSDLRKTILLLAVQGKLVPQDPEEGSAEELMQSINNEREYLIRQKSLRKSTRVGDLKDLSIPFVAPGNWAWTQLCDICFQITDGAHHTPLYVAAGIPFLSVKDVSKGFIDFSNTRFVSEATHAELTKRCKPELGDVLLTKVGTTGIGVTVDTQVDFSIFVSLALLKLSKKHLEPRYITLAINSPLMKAQSAEGTQGIGNKNLVLKTINQLLIPLPPLAEQRRIVAKVEELISMVDELEEMEKQATDRGSSLLDAIVHELAATAG